MTKIKNSIWWEIPLFEIEKLIWWEMCPEKAYQKNPFLLKNLT